MSKTQCDKLKSHLRRGRTVTVRSAMLDLGIASLHRRLTDLKAEGMAITGTWETTPGGTRFKRYRAGRKAA